METVVIDHQYGELVKFIVLDTLSLQADEGNIRFKTLLLGIDADCLKQSRLITTRRSVSVQHRRSTIRTGPRLDICRERFDGEVLDIDA